MKVVCSIAWGFALLLLPAFAASTWAAGESTPIWAIDTPVGTPGGETAHTFQGMGDWLPTGLVNVAVDDFGNRVGGGDYGLANFLPIEVIAHGDKTETRVVRSPELHLGHTKKANFQVKVGNLDGLYFWLETPPVSSRWIVILDMVYPDGFRRNIWHKDTKPGVRHWIDVDPHTVIDATIITPEATFKLSKRFHVTFSPALYAVWPETFISTPTRTLWE